MKKPKLGLTPLNISTGGIHPQIASAMKSRLSAQVTPNDRSQALKGLKRGLMSIAERASTRRVIGRMPRG